MKRWQRWRQLSASERHLLIRAGVWVALARLVLSVLPFQQFKRLLNPTVLAAQTQTPVDSLAWAVRAAARVVPAATCLTQAVALKWMLARAGYTATIHIGVNQGTASKFSAHAWIERNGQIMLGEEEAGRYSQLLAW